METVSKTHENEATDLSKDLEDFILIKVKDASNENQDIVLPKVLTISPMESGSTTQTKIIAPELKDS